MRPLPRKRRRSPVVKRREGATFKYAKTYYDGAYYLLLNNEAFDTGFSVKFKYQEFGFIEIYENCDSPIVRELNPPTVKP